MNKYELKFISTRNYSYSVLILGEKECILLIEKTPDSNLNLIEGLLRNR
jgi:hypothetical protein